MTFFQCGPCPKKKISNFVDFANSFHATINFTHEMSSEKIVFLDTEVFKGPQLRSLTAKLWMFKHITSLQKRFNICTSLEVTLSVLRRVLLKEKLCVY